MGTRAVTPRRRVGMRRQEQLFLDFRRWGWDNKGWSRETRDKYYRQARAANGWLEQHRGVSLFWASPKDLRAYLFTKGSSARNRNNVRQALVAFDDFLEDQEIIDFNRAVGLPRLPEPENIPKAITLDEAKRIIRASKVFGPMWHACILTFLYTGFRITNVLELQWKEFDPGMEWVHVRIKPRSKDHRIPVHEQLQRALVTWRTLTDEPRWVFPSPIHKGRHMSRKHMFLKVKEIAAFANLEGVHPHVLRHTACTWLLESSGNIRSTQKFMGHADPKTTAAYARVFDFRLEADLSKLDFGR